VLSFRSEAREILGSETVQLNHAARRGAANRTGVKRRADGGIGPK
jgi:hypothetical protein